MHTTSAACLAHGLPYINIIMCRSYFACSPFSYALRAIVVYEMTHDRWSAPAPGNPQQLTLAEEGLDTFGFFTERYWIWVGEHNH